VLASKLPLPTDQERAQVVTLVSDYDEEKSDAARVAMIASVAYPADPMGQARWLAFMAAECEVLVLPHQARIEASERRCVPGPAAAGRAVCGGATHES
jgi:hypothetical protein